jgi:hypothetical protein
MELNVGDKFTFQDSNREYRNMVLEQNSEEYRMQSLDESNINTVWVRGIEELFARYQVNYKIYKQTIIGRDIVPKIKLKMRVVRD